MQIEWVFPAERCFVGELVSSFVCVFAVFFLLASLLISSMKMAEQSVLRKNLACGTVFRFSLLREKLPDSYVEGNFSSCSP